MFVCSIQLSENFTVYVLYIVELAKSVSDQVNCNLKSKPISSICQVGNNNQLTCTCFSFAELPPRKMLEGLMVLAKEFHNYIFEYFWKKNSESFSASKQNMEDVLFSEVHEKVWKPTISNCQVLLCKIHDKSVTFAELSVYGHLQDLDSHLQALCSGMCKCYPSSNSLPLPGEWIRQAVNHFMSFQRFSNSIKKNGIAYCLLLKESLKLKGEFSVVEDLNKQVSQ